MCNIISVLYAIIAVIFFQFPWSTDVQFSTTMSKFLNIPLLIACF
jgi:hypothetical protein